MDNEFKKQGSEEKADITTVVFTIIMIALIACIIVFKGHEEPKVDTSTNDRFECVYEQNKGVSGTIYIIVDREKDVEYMLIATPNGTGLTTMRDSNGMVLLRE